MISSGSSKAEPASCSGGGLPRSSDSPPGRPNKPGSTGRSAFPRTSNKGRPVGAESGTGLQAGCGDCVLDVTPLYMGLRVSRLSGVSALGVVGLTDRSSVWGEATALAGALYGGDGLMKFRGGDARLGGVGQAVTTGAVGARAKLAPLQMG